MDILSTISERTNIEAMARGELDNLGIQRTPYLIGRNSRDSILNAKGGQMVLLARSYFGR